MTKIACVSALVILMSLESGALAHMAESVPSVQEPFQVPGQSGGPTNDFNPRAVEGVIDEFKLWQTGSTLNACFFDGGVQFRDSFVDVSKQWTSITNLKIDFGKAPNYNRCSGAAFHLRIAFGHNNDKRDWSYVGTDSIRKPMDQPSLNIGYALGLDPAFINDEFRGVVLHELGHALALQHEHQSPEAKCDQEFDWAKVYASLSPRMDEATIDYNFKGLIKTPRLRTTPYDRTSIMHYYFPEWMFIKGSDSRCFVGHNLTLSEMDKRAIASAYPKEAREQLELVNSRRNFASDVLAQLTSDPKIREFLEKTVEAAKVRQVETINSTISNSPCANMSGGITQTASPGSANVACQNITGDQNIGITNNIQNQSGNWGTINNQGTTNFNQSVSPAVPNTKPQ